MTRWKLNLLPTFYNKFWKVGIKMIDVHAVGRLTKSAELRTTNSGRTVTNFTLACKRKRPDKEGNIQTTFVSCILWGKPAQVFVKYTQKGVLVGVNGELQTRSYDDQQGVTHYITEVVIDDFEFLESKETLQSREQKQKNVPQSNSVPDPEENKSMEQELPYEQPSINGITEYGYNDF